MRLIDRDADRACDLSFLCTAAPRPARLRFALACHAVCPFGSGAQDRIAARSGLSSYPSLSLREGYEVKPTLRNKEKQYDDSENQHENRD